VKYLSRLIAICCLVSSLFYPVHADVVKPALVEISVFTTEVVEVEIRASLEALLTGINGKYRNTKQAPNSGEYDHYREMEAVELRAAFEAFVPTLLEGVEIAFDGKPSTLHLKDLVVPEPGYTKVPRNSVIILEGTIPKGTKTLTWYYPMAFGDHATRVRQVDVETEEYHWSSHQWVKEDVPTKPFKLDAVFAKPTIGEVIQTYTVSGYQHILPMGLDHILFILGIFLLSPRLKPILLQVTMFTVAHSITLALGMYGLVEVSARIVEPLIALSIAFVAIENIFFTKINPFRLPIVFGFGLLHGLGFASVLTDFGMPTEDFLAALLAFNVGVELGQITIVLAAFFGVAVWFKSQEKYHRLVVVPASLLIAATGLFWFVDRLAIF
jgi:hypothetical protein